MLLFKFSLLILALLTGCSLATDSWSVLSKDIMTVCMGVHMQTNEIGEVAGYKGLEGPIVKRTVDAGASWTVQHQERDIGLAVYMCLAFDEDNDCGVSSGIGFDVKEVSSIHTMDGGITWNDTNDNNFAASFQDCEPVVGDDNMFVLTGSWTDIFDASGWGVAISHNKGTDFDHYDWGLDTEPRYGSFANSTVGWISGGFWPEASVDSQFYYRITQHVGLKKDEEGVLHKAFIPSESLGIDDGFVGIIAKTVDGGQTWTVQYNDTGKLYFNAIFAANENDVWAVAEGAVGAWIIHTADGGVTWETQLFAEGASMMAVKFFDNLEGWVAGTSSGTFGGAFWHTVDGGVNWEVFEVADYAPDSLDLLDPDHVYATAFTKTGHTALLQYTA